MRWPVWVVPSWMLDKQRWWHIFKKTGAFDEEEIQMLRELQFHKYIAQCQEKGLIKVCKMKLPESIHIFLEVEDESQ